MADQAQNNDYKSDIRTKVWAELAKVARPDSRFHYDFSSFIADFDGSAEATELLLRHRKFTFAKVIFITPDNCLEHLRLEALRARKTILMTTYAIRRGFWLLSHNQIPVESYAYASTLDGMEKMGRPITLDEMQKEELRVDLMVTGTGAINREGVRFGKGHGFFDLEWGILHSLGLVETEKNTVAVVHDCQILDEKLVPEEFDTVCDIIVTPTNIIEVEEAKKPECGILWDRLEPGMLESIPPLQELQRMQHEGTLSKRSRG